VQELWDKKNYNRSKMTKEDAEDFLDQVMRSRDPRIATFRDAIKNKSRKFNQRYDVWLLGEDEE